MSASPSKPRPRPIETILSPPGKITLFNLDELWVARGMLNALVWRLLKVRYANTMIGAGWAVLQPLSLMIVFTVFLGMLVRVPSDGIPYALFVYCGLVFWQFASNGFGQGSASVVLNVHLVTKVYFPRVFLPLAVILSGLADLVFGLPALVALMLYFGFIPGWPLLLLPFFVLLAMIAVFGSALWGAALYVVYRDVAHVLPFLAQVWMFVTPVIYPVSVVPEKFLWLYALNPMVAVVEGGRWIFAGGAAPSLPLLIVSTVSAILILVTGYIYFRRREAIFPDLI